MSNTGKKVIKRRQKPGGLVNRACRTKKKFTHNKNRIYIWAMQIQPKKSVFVWGFLFD